MKTGMILLVCFALLSGSAAFAAEPDFSDMTLEELYSARAAIDARIEALEDKDDSRIYDSGSYLVGEDIPEGDYVLVENEDAVFASVAIRGGVTEDSELLGHHIVNRQIAIHLSKGTWVTLTDARAYPLAIAPRSEDGRAGEGGYLVGVTLPSGDYVLSLEDKAPLCSYSVYDGALNSGEQLLKFELIHETTEITLDAGQYIELSGCNLAPKED